MKRWLPILLSIFVLGASIAVRAETDAEVRARKDALDVAGAFSNDGFKIRDGHWCGILKPHEHTLVTVNLYAGNQYWFSTATIGKAKKVSVDIFDETGKPVVTESYNSGDRASAGFSPINSGQYFVSLSVVEGEAGTFCLVY